MLEQRIIILTENEIREALDLYFHSHLLKDKIVDDVIEALVLYSSPARINMHNYSISSAMTVAEQDAIVNPEFVKEQLLYSLEEKLADEQIVLKSTNKSGLQMYKSIITYRFHDFEDGYEVLDV